MKLKLSTRAMTVLVFQAFREHDEIGWDQHGLLDIPDHLIERISSPEQLLKYRNCGVKTAKEIVAELERQGVKINGRRPWEESKRKMVCPHCGERIKLLEDLYAAAP